MREPRLLALALASALAAVTLWLIAGHAASSEPRGAGTEPEAVAAGAAPTARGADVGERPSTAAPAAGERTEVAPRGPDSETLAPVLVRGRVVDDLGVPVAGATVTVQRERTRAIRHGDSTWIFDGEGTVTAVQTILSVRVASEAVTGSPNRLVPGTPEPVPLAISIMPSGDAFVIGKLDLQDPNVSGISVVERLFSPGVGGPVISATTDAEGRFEIRRDGVEPPLVVNASLHAHVDDSEAVTSVGAEILLTLQRAAILDSTVLLPEWLPPDAVGLELTPLAGGETVPALPVEEAESGRMHVSSGSVAPGIHDLQVRVRGLSEPVFRVPDLSLVVGERQPDGRATTIDLTHAVFRYEVRAVDVSGASIDDLASPLLARVGEGDGRTWAAFPWRDGRIEIFAPRASLDVVAFAPGFRLQRRTLYAGESDVLFVALQPVEVVLPGLRALCGPDRRVRISMVKQGGTGLPTSIQATDPRTGETQGYSRWHLGMSSGAWLGTSDTVLVPLVLDGRYEVIVRLHEEDVGGDHSLTCTEADVVMDGFARPRVTVTIDPDRVRAGLEDLRRRASR